MNITVRRLLVFACLLFGLLLCLSLTAQSAAARAKPASVDILTAPTDYPFGQPYTDNSSHPLTVATADLNGDGKPDFVVAATDYNGGSTVFVRLNNGDGTFGASHGYASYADGSTLTLADVNSDGKTDIVMCTQGGSTVNYLPGNGDGTFGDVRTIPTMSTLYTFAVGDVNGDAKADIVLGG